MSSDPCTVEFSYDVGDGAYLQGHFTYAETGQPVDPQQVFFTFVKPDGTETTWQYAVDTEIGRDDVGAYSVQIDLDQAGVWFYRWHSEGYGQAAEQRYFGVRATGPADCPETDFQQFVDDNPLRVRGDQGEVQSRTMADAIQGDQYNRKLKTNRFAVARQSVMGSNRYVRYPRSR